MKKLLLLLTGATLAIAAQTVDVHAQTVTTYTFTNTIENFTVPACVTSITIEARGAQGGYNTSSTTQSGLGAIMVGTFTVTPGQVLKILVGEQPSAAGGNGGGGGSFVTDNSNNPLIVAGGGGGSSQGADSPDKHGQVGTSGGTGAGGGGTGGTAGSGGGIGASGFQAGAGGGLLTNGADGWTTNTGGLAFVNGGSGGTANANARGGFGGGGSGSSYVVGGAGGGYSGGGSGGNSTAGVGGGGGSYNAGTNPTNTGGVNSGHGVVILTYTMGPAMPASVTGTSMVCEGATISVTAATVVGATSYTWTVPASATILSGQGTNVIQLYVGSASGTASVVANDACASSTAATFSYTVNANPTIAATTTTPDVCAGSSATLLVTGATTYNWSSGGTGSSELVTPSVASTYTVIGTDANGCADTTTISVGVNPLPVVTLGNDTAVCGSLMLDAQNSGNTFNWSEGSTTQTITVTNSGPYDVIVTDTNGCEGRDTINVTINAYPVVTGSTAMSVVCLDDATVVLNGSPAGGTWSGAGVSGSTFEPDTAGAGTHALIYAYTDSVGCSGADTISIDVDLCLGVNANDISAISIYPNPNNGTFNVVVPVTTSTMEIVITDVQGRIVYQSKDAAVNAGTVKPITLDEPAGVYFMQVITADASSTYQVTLTK